MPGWATSLWSTTGVTYRGAEALLHRFMCGVVVVVCQAGTYACKYSTAELQLLHAALTWHATICNLQASYLSVPSVLTHQASAGGGEGGVGTVVGTGGAHQNCSCMIAARHDDMPPPRQVYHQASAPTCMSARQRALCHTLLCQNPFCQETLEA